LFSSLRTRNDFTLNLEPIVLLHAFDEHVPKRRHWGENSSASDLLVWEFVKVQCKRETGFRNYPSGSEVARFTVSLDDRLDFG